MAEQGWLSLQQLFAEMDESTAALIIQLQIEDSQELSSSIVAKGKGREGEVSDTQVALAIHLEELQRNVTVIKDRQMTKSIADACQRDGEIVAVLRSQEQAAAADHAVACRLARQAPPAITRNLRATTAEVDNESLGRLSALYVAVPDEGKEEVISTLNIVLPDHDEQATKPEKAKSNEDDEYANTGTDREHTEPESSSWAITRVVSLAEKHHECVACQEPFLLSEVARAPCGHEYCTKCLRGLFTWSIKDLTLFPPRCCQQNLFFANSVKDLLTLELVEQYEGKKLEVDTVNPTYCSNLACSSFVRPENITNDVATCPSCITTTCVICKAASHTGDCPADTSLQQLLATANENEWQRCYKCRTLVALDYGCNHIICRCHAQFCYTCGLKWKTCGCARWNEEHLYARATQVVARRPSAVDLPAQEAAVADEVQNLRDGHNCNHWRFEKVDGSHQCEECYYQLPDFILECTRCRIQLCCRCRYNRL